MSGFTKFYWQHSCLNFSISQKFDPSDFMRINAICTLKMIPHEAVESNVQGAVLALKLLLIELFNSKVTVASINFFRIRGQKPILKKKKNVNLSICLKFNFFQDFASSDLNRLLSILIFWKSLTKKLRNYYKIEFGYLRRLHRAGKGLQIFIINPQYLNEYLGVTLNDKTLRFKNAVLKLNINIHDVTMYKEISRLL